MCKRVVQGIIFIGFSVQIVLGLVWMACNIFSVQDFAEVTTGAYAGITYLFRRVCPLLYVLQILAALYAGARLTGQLCGCGKRGFFSLWGSLALLTLPMAMQCHLALLPHSFVCSAGLLQMSFFCELFRTDGVLKPGMASKNSEYYENSELPGRKEVFRLRLVAGICGCYLAQAALLPEYALMGAAAPAAALLLARKGMARERKRLQIVLILAVTAAAAVGIHTAWPAEAGENDISGPEWTLFKRVCWPTIWQDSQDMPPELAEAVSPVLWDCHSYPGEMDAVFKPAVEAAMDAEEAKRQLTAMMAGTWEEHYPMIIRQIGWDVLGYSVTPVILQAQLSGDAYESCSGRNYAIMRSHTPILTERYVSYGSWWFAAAVILTALLLGIRLVMREKPYGVTERRLFLAILPYAVCSVLWYALQGAGIMDYKYTVLVNQFWILWSLKTLADGSGPSRNREKGA